MSSESRFASVVMLCLTMVALLVAGAVYVEDGDMMQSGLFIVLAALAGWQAFHWPN